MRRTVCVVSLAGAFALAAVVLFKPLASPAEDAPPAKVEKRASPAAPQLPVTRVTLYSSGVGYFQREGAVEGDARIDLAFPVQDVNDLLKSMVLEDLGGGTISAASFDSQDPLNKALGSFAINLAENPSFAELLQQARGESVEVLLKKDARPITGRVVGIEPGFKELVTSGGKWNGRPPDCPAPPTVANRWRQSCGAPPVVAYYANPNGTAGALTPEAGLEAALVAYAGQPARLNLWSAEGVRSIPLTDVQRVRFLNPAMDREVRRALEVLAGAHDTQKRAVNLTFTGAGKRKVRVGYVVESPLWRTSYRLLIGKNGKLFMQGWAVVENPTGEDWKDVRLSLVSGRPISFKMDLSQPLYLPRPTMQLEGYAMVAPTTHAGGVPTPNAPPIMPGNGLPALAPMASSSATAAPPPPRVNAPAAGPQSINNDLLQINLQRGVVAAATAKELCDYFEYDIRHPVSLPRQKSAMLPIVSKAVEGTRVSIYNPATHAKFPLLALRLKNTSGVHLMQGPVAVFEGTGYAGDAHLLDLRPGEERLVSYAVDLGTEVEPQTASGSARLTAIKIQKGILLRTTKAREVKTYTARNRSKQERTVVIEHPYRADYRLVSKAKPVERTADVLRFELKVPAGKAARLEVAEERDLTEQLSLCGCEEQALQDFLKAVTCSAEVRRVVEKAVELKGKLTATQQRLAQLQGQLQEIAKDQVRLRANLKEMPEGAAAYKRYLAKFDRQETDIEQLQADVRELKGAEARQREDYATYWGRVEIGPTPAREAERILPPPAPTPPPPPPPPPVNPENVPVSYSGG